MNADEQEALSRKYANEVCRVLILESGRIAVFGCDCVLLTVVETWEEVGKAVAEYVPSKPHRPKRKAVLDLDIDLDSITI